MEAVMKAVNPSARDEDDVSVEELAHRQGVRRLRSPADLEHAEVWESDEELDAFLADLDARRHARATSR